MIKETAMLCILGPLWLVDSPHKSTSNHDMFSSLSNNLLTPVGPDAEAAHITAAVGTRLWKEKKKKIGQNITTSHRWVSARKM